MALLEILLFCREQVDVCTDKAFLCRDRIIYDIILTNLTLKGIVCEYFLQEAVEAADRQRHEQDGSSSCDWCLDCDDGTLIKGRASHDGCASSYVQIFEL